MATSNNKKVEKIAKRILDNTKIDDKDHGFIDPITIILIISVILTLIRVIQECRKNRGLLNNKKEYASLLRKDIQDIVLKDSWLNRLRLQKVLRKQLSKEQYKVYNKPLQLSIMETGVNLTEDEVFSLMEAANA